MRNCISLILLLGVISCNMQAKDGDIIPSLRKAASEKNPEIRLKMYDKILEDAGIKVKKEEKHAEAGNWIMSKKIDPITDENTFTFILAADSGKSVYGDEITLILRHKGKKNEVYINWNSYLGSEAFVTTRVGTDKALRREWSLSTDSKATFYPDNTLEFIKKLLVSDRLVVQCTPYSESPITAIFHLDGLTETVKPYLAELSW